MLNVSPMGRNCSQEERDDFEKYDKVHNIPPKMVSPLCEKFAHLNLTFSIGGQISFDVGDMINSSCWCLKWLIEGGFQSCLLLLPGACNMFPLKIGTRHTACNTLMSSVKSTSLVTKTDKGGNDREIYESERTQGHKVTIPEDTVEQCRALFLSDS